MEGYAEGTSLSQAFTPSIRRFNSLVVNFRCYIKGPPTGPFPGELSGQHLTQCEACKHFLALSMPALRREAAWAEGRFLGALPSSNLSPRTAVSIYTYRSSQNNYHNNCLRIFFGSGSVTDYQINSPEIFLGKVGNSVNISR